MVLICFSFKRRSCSCTSVVLSTFIYKPEFETESSLNLKIFRKQKTNAFILDLGLDSVKVLQ